MLRTAIIVAACVLLCRTRTGMARCRLRLVRRVGLILLLWCAPTLLLGRWIPVAGLLLMRRRRPAGCVPTRRGAVIGLTLLRVLTEGGPSLLGAFMFTGPQLDQWPPSGHTLLYGKLTPDQITRASIAEQAFERGDHAASLQALAALKAPVDAFFDGVMVNAEEMDLRLNRQGLLKSLHVAMNRVADLSRLAA